MQLRWVLCSQRAGSRAYFILPPDSPMAIWSGIVDHYQIYSASRGDGRFFCSQPLILLSDSTYECTTRQNAALTGQERQEDVQLKLC